MLHRPIHQCLTLCTLIASLSACASLQPSASANTKLLPKSGSQVTGNIAFTKVSNGMEVSGKVSGLKPNQSHGFHIHEKGDCTSDDALNAGVHFNPEGKRHGTPAHHHNHDHSHSADHHAGDMPNLKADANGVAVFKVVLSGITIYEGVKAIAGRAVIVHANEDDYVSQPVGNAGGRIACGLIQ
jgi:superoxide dismutase, Cu-Zn family